MHNVNLSCVVLITSMNGLLSNNLCASFISWRSYHGA